MRQSHPFAKFASGFFILGLASLVLGSLVVSGLALFHVVPWSYLMITIGIFAVAYILNEIGLKFPETSDPELRAKYASQPLVLAVVVQGANHLFDPEAASYGNAVVAFSLDPARRFDINYLNQLSAQLTALRDNPSAATAADQKEVGKKLNSTRTSFTNELVPLSVAGAPQTYYTVIMIDSNKFAGAKIPDHRIIPLFLALKGDRLDTTDPEVVPQALWL